MAEWRKDNALSLGAALAFYTLFSLAPLLVLIIAIVGLVFGRAAAQGEIVASVGGAVGPDAAKVLEGMIAKASAPASGVIATVASLATLPCAASGVFGQQQTSPNQLCGATAGQRRGVRALVRSRRTSCCSCGCTARRSSCSWARSSPRCTRAASGRGARTAAEHTSAARRRRAFRSGRRASRR